MSKNLYERLRETSSRGSYSSELGQRFYDVVVEAAQTAAKKGLYKLEIYLPRELRHSYTSDGMHDFPNSKNEYPTHIVNEALRSVKEMLNMQGVAVEIDYDWGKLKVGWR